MVLFGFQELLRVVDSWSEAINMTEEVEDELGTPLKRKQKWAIGMRACDSEACPDIGLPSSLSCCKPIDARLIFIT